MKVKLLTDGCYLSVTKLNVVGQVFNAFPFVDAEGIVQRDQYIVEIPGVSGGIFSSKGRMFLASEIEIVEK